MTVSKSTTKHTTAASRAKEDVKGAARTAADKTESVGHKVSNAVEDIIPGDSDGDGH